MAENFGKPFLEKKHLEEKNKNSKKHTHSL